MSIVKEEIGKGINLYLYKLDKFKTVSINVYIQNKLNEEATQFALLPAVLKRGTSNLKTYKDITMYLENLYGATFMYSVYKKGERQISHFRLEIADDNYINDNVLERGIKFLGDVLFNPLIENNSFNKQYIEQEKVVQRNIINSRINEKTKYALERCIEIMCKEENYSIYELGNVDDLEKINETNLYEYYKKCISTYPIDIYIVGNIDLTKVSSLVKKYFAIDRQYVESISDTQVNKEVKNVNYVKEKYDIKQGKLTLGFRTNINANDSLYFPLLVYSGVLGGGPFSKLFMNVREKASLAYYAQTNLERFKGLMFIMSGIEIDNYERALDIIVKQIDDIKHGNITQYEFESTLKALKTSMNSIKDNATQISDFYLSQNIAHSNYDLNEFINRINEVKLDDIVNVAQKVKLDTVYFMTNKEGGTVNE